MRRCSALWLALAVLALPSCLGSSNMQRVDDCLLTFYTVPAKLRAGEVRAAVRIQDRDYRILGGYQGLLQTTVLPSGATQTVPLKSGPGRDLRAWLTLPKGERYAFDFQLVSPEGNSLHARFTAEPKR